MFSCGRVCHYVAQFPYKENRDKEKGKNVTKKNSKIIFTRKKSFYTHEDSECYSNDEDDDS